MKTTKLLTLLATLALCACTSVTYPIVSQGYTVYDTACATDSTKRLIHRQKDDVYACYSTEIINGDTWIVTNFGKGKVRILLMKG